MQEATRLAKGVDELREAMGGRTANIYQFACGSVVCFAPDAPDFREAAELKGKDLAAAQRILDERGISGGNAGCFSAPRTSRRLWRVYSGDERYWGIPLTKIEALHGDSVAMDFDRCAPNPAKSRTFRPKPCLAQKIADYTSTPTYSLSRWCRTE